MKRYTFSTKALSFSIILSCGMFFPQIIEAQKANKILDLLQQGKINSLGLIYAASTIKTA